MATFGLKEMGKFLWEGKEKILPSWLSQFSFAIAKFVWKTQKKVCIMKSGLDAMPLFLLDDLLSEIEWNMAAYKNNQKLFLTNYQLS